MDIYKPVQYKNVSRKILLPMFELSIWNVAFMVGIIIKYYCIYYINMILYYFYISSSLGV